MDRIEFVIVFERARKLFCGCGTGEKPAEGIIKKIEKQSISGVLCGNTEFSYQGTWGSSYVYESGDSVFYNHRFWRNAGAGQGVTPSPSSSGWVAIDAVLYLKKTFSHTMSYNSQFSYPPLDPEDPEDHGQNGNSHGGHNFQQTITYAPDPTTYPCTSSTICTGTGTAFEYTSYGEGTDNSWVYNEDCTKTIDPEGPEPITNDDVPSYSDLSYREGQTGYTFSGTESPTSKTQKVTYSQSLYDGDYTFFQFG